MPRLLVIGGLLSLAMVAGLGTGLWPAADSLRPGLLRSLGGSGGLGGGGKEAHPPDGTIRAMVCDWGPCLLVQAEGLNFLVGASRNSADFLWQTGLLQDSELDAVLLSGLSLDEIEGLATIRDLTWRAGRDKPLSVFGPSGTKTMVSGLKTLVQAHDAEMRVRHSMSVLPFRGTRVRAEAFTPPDEGEMVFDSGLVVISVWPVRQPTSGAHLIYRFDTPGKTLIVARCGAGPDDIRRAARQASAQAGLVLEMTSTEWVTARRQQTDGKRAERLRSFAGNPDCPDLDIWPDQALSGLGLTSLMAAPLVPPVHGRREQQEWQRRLKRAGRAEDVPPWQAGLPGRALLMETPE